MNGFSFIIAVAAALHRAVLSFAFGPWHWMYLLVSVASGIVLWGVLPALVPLRRQTARILGVALALAAQQVVFWFWRAKLDGVGWPLAQFASVHFLIGAVSTRLRRRRPCTFVWRGTMLNQRR